MNDELPRELTEKVAETYQRLLDHVEDHMVEQENITISFTQWDDGDYRIEAFHAFDSRRLDIKHGEEIRYKHSEGEFRYSNFTREHGWHDNRCFEEYVIEEWIPTGET